MKKKYILRVICVSLFLLGGILLYKCADYLIVNDVNAYTRVAFHDFYEQDNVEILFSGPSHALRGINANKISELTGKNVFNLGTTSQQFDGGYYVIRDAVEHHGVKNIYYEVSTSRFSYAEPMEVATYIISDYLDRPLLRAEYLTEAFSSDKFVNSFLRMRREFKPTEPKSIKDLKTNYSLKSSEQYINYEGGIGYAGKGQWAMTSSLDVFGTVAGSSSDTVRLDEVEETAWEDFIRILEYCEKNDVNITLIVMPYSEQYLSEYDGYTEIHQYISSTAAQYGINMIDLNLVKEEYLDLGASDYYDYEHMNYDGSVKLAEFLAKYIDNPSEEYFCNSLEERHPKTDEVLAVNYSRMFVSDINEAEKEDAVEGEIRQMKVSVWPNCAVDCQAEARLWPLISSADGTTYEEGTEITGITIDDFTTQFVMEYDKCNTLYRVVLYKPGTDEVLYEAYTRFALRN